MFIYILYKYIYMYLRTHYIIHSHNIYDYYKQASQMHRGNQCWATVHDVSPTLNQH